MKVLMKQNFCLIFYCFIKRYCTAQMIKKYVYTLAQGKEKVGRWAEINLPDFLPLFQTCKYIFPANFPK